MKYVVILATAIIAVCLAVCLPEPSMWVLSLPVLGMATQAALGPLTDRVRPYELVRWEPDMRYTRTAGTIKNVSGGSILAGAIQCGLPLAISAGQYQSLNAGSESTTVGLFLGDDAMSIPEALANNAITANKYPILVRGPALVNKSIISLTDLAGSTYTLATIVTALNGLNPPIYTLVESPTIGTQNT